MTIRVHKFSTKFGTYEWSGLSTDVKSVTEAYGSTFYETDTRRMYVYTYAGWILKETLVKQAPIYIHTIAITVVDPAAAQTDVITIDGVACSFTSDATPTTTEISTGLRAAIAASAIAGRFIVTGVTNVILTPAGVDDPVVSVSANLTDVQTTGEAHIGEVGYWSDLIVVTPAIAAAAFTANDVVGGKLILAGAVRMEGGKGKITGIKIVDTSKQNANLLVFLFGADLAGIYADNSVEAVTVADWLKWIGTIKILATDYEQMANASLVDLGFEIDVKIAAGTTLYGLMVTTSTPTYGANALQLTFGVREGN